MLDCGIHPGHQGLASLPFLDEVDLASVDACLVTHFHLDHCAAVPYLVGRTPFRGRLLMTHPTKAIFYTLLRDYVRVSAGSSGDEQLYAEADLERAMQVAEVIDFDQTVDLGGGLRVTAHRAGHVLGAAMFTVEIGGARVLYTGDYSRAADRHLGAADLPPPSLRPDAVIVEATYGVSRHLPREVRERRLIDRVAGTVLGGGRVLLPIVALGRAQELLLLLEEHWRDHPELHGVPIYQASGLARKALSVYQTYVEAMNDDVRAAFAAQRNPFRLEHVRFLRGAAEFDDSGPCVMMATPSMLQSGLSRDLFEAWCEDPRNALIIADFAVQGTLARDVLSNPSHVTTRSGTRVPLRCTVEAISFSAHADFEQTSGFLEALRPPHVVLVHGEAGEMARLRGALERLARAGGYARTVHTPRVVSTARIPVPLRREATVLGRLAEGGPFAGRASAGAGAGGAAVVRGVLVSGAGGGAGAPGADGSGIGVGAAAAVGGGGGGARAVIVAPEDLPAFTKLRTGRVLHRQAVALPDEEEEEEGGRGGGAGRLSRGFAAVRLALEVAFEGVEGSGRMAVRSSRSRSRSADAAVADAKKGGADEQDGGDADAAARAELEGEEEAVTIGGVVAVRHRRADPSRGHGRHVVIEWEGGALGDLVADAVVAVVLQAAGEPASARRADAARRAALGRGDGEGARAAEADLVAALLRAQFGRVTRARLGPASASSASASASPEEDDEDDDEEDDDGGDDDEAGAGGGNGGGGNGGGRRYLLRVDVDGDLVSVAPRRGHGPGEAFRVTCDANPALRARVEKALERMAEAMRPAALA